MKNNLKKKEDTFKKTNFRLKALLTLTQNPLQALSPYQIPRSAKYLRVFEDRETGDVFATTDLAAQINKRNRALRKFSQKYKKKLIGKNGHITIYSMIANIEDYPNISQLMRPIRTRLKRHNIPVKGYIWLRDRGNYEFVPHYHLLIVINRENNSKFEKICSKYKLKLDPQKTCGMANNYLKQKEVFAKHGQRIFGTSRTFDT